MIWKFNFSCHLFVCINEIMDRWATEKNIRLTSEFKWKKTTAHGYRKQIECIKVSLQKWKQEKYLSFFLSIHLFFFL